ncbi:polysaccharide deacetylase family protein [Ferdinandcohnia quinoae]|uniref:Polysaccharide deacetylase family protein n=1 Tax=Fredinandcohnia quinoae TaxID=2918902 RepID=A0AAW5E681_9BACI|nr:polysaccharide deacetylase family protein [Fredinandcohnia sp. SECRCQ15]MCH1624279.1 polysaccharide deacetylase family protein [Fredinandcohnia sp. SECRCQ15]
MSGRMNRRRRRKRKLHFIKLVGLFSFIILVGLSSYLILQSKFQAEANAAPPKSEQSAEHNLKEDLKDQIDKNKAKDKATKENNDSLEQEKLDKKKANSNKETDEKNTEKENSKNSEKNTGTDKVIDKKPPTNATEPPVTTSKTVYLTFDDGPHKVSGDILALLEEYNAKATFFMLDGNMKMYPDAVKKMVQQGHGVGSHGVTHDKNKFYKSTNSVIGEMSQTLQTIHNLTGVDSDLIRTPYGSSPHMTPAYKKAVVNAGYKMWDWNIDSRDWYFKDSRYVDSVIEQFNKVKNGNEPIVILLHEKPETLAQLPKLLDYLSEQNYEFKAIDSSMEPIQFP